jgi:hypothetical protein
MELTAFLKFAIRNLQSEIFLANAGVEYMVSESQGSNPVPLDSLSWDPLTDFVAINSGVNAGRTTSANLSLVEPETPAVATPRSKSFHSCHPFSYYLHILSDCGFQN